jgi:hypothetical protein
MTEKLDFNDIQTGTTNIPKISSISESLSLMTTDFTKKYTHFSSTSEMSEQTSTDQTTLRILSTEHLTPIPSDSTLSAEHINYSTEPTEIVSNDYSTSIGETTLSTDLPNRYSQFSTSTTQELDEEKSTFASTFSTEDSTEYLHSSISTGTSLEATRMTSPFDLVQSTFLSSEKSSTIDSTSSSYETSTILIENSTPFFNINNEHTTVQSLSTDVESISLDTTLSTTSEYLSDVTVPHFSTPLDLSTSQINDMIISTNPLETTSIQNQFHSSTIESSSNNISDDLYDGSPMTTDSSINPVQTSTSSITVTDFIDKETEDGINQMHSSPMLVEVNVSSTLHSSSPFILSSTTFIPSPSSQSPPSLHPSFVYSSPTSTELNRLLLSKHFSETTTMSTPFTTLSSSISTLQTTDLATTSDVPEQSSMITLSSSPLITSYPDYTSSVTYAMSSESTTTDYPMLSTTIISSTILDSTTTVQTEEPSTTTDYEMLTTTIVSSTILDSTTTVQTDEPSTLLLKTTDDEETSAITDSLPFETISGSSITDGYPDEYTSTQSSLEIASTIFPDIYTFQTEHPTPVIIPPKPPSNRPPRRKTSESTTSSTTTPTTTTKNPYRTRKQKTTSLILPSSTTTTTTTTTTTSTALVQITSIFEEFSTSSPIPFRHSKLNSLQQQQVIVIKPSLNTNSSNILLSNELLDTLINSITNSSNEKFIIFNLVDLPPSSWNISLNTNQSVLLDIVLPPALYPSSLNTTTNLTITNVDANRFATNIFGVPLHLQVDQIQTKQFSLAMNLTNNHSNQSLSDVVIGHIRSEQFELNITKSDNMNLHVQQVDSETAELFFDSKFCTNESNLQINLNISKNGKLNS